MAKFYADENFPLPAVLQLRRLGHDVLTVSEYGHANCGLSDPEILQQAVSLSRILLTLNRKHFIRLHEQTPDHCGILVCTMDRDFIGLARRVHDAVGQTPDLMTKLIRVNRPS